MVEIPKDKKQRIFEGWFVKGDPRDGIAVDVDVGEGSVTNVVEYEEVIGKPVADLLRKQAVARRKAGLKPEHVITDAMIAQEIGEAGIGSETARKLFKGVIGLIASSSPATLAGTTAENLVKAAASVCEKALDEEIEIKMGHLERLDNKEPGLPIVDAVHAESGVPVSYSGSTNLLSAQTYIEGRSSPHDGSDTPSP